MPAPDEPAVDAALAAAVAHLARLGLTDDERRAAAAQLAGILGHFRALQDVDTQGVAPLVHTLEAPGAPAADEVAALLDARARLLGLAPHAREGFLVVPRVLNADFGPDEPADRADPEPADPDPADEESPG
jgi:aspartyl-tRNA(Asn)/glutamyl-tRNA(Gln) amidotransferase subunit C